MITGRPSVSRISAKIGSAALRPTPARGRARGPIGLVEGRLEDEADGAPRRDLLQRRRHLERMGAALDLARSGDQRERQRGAETGRERPLADLNDGVVAQRNVPLSAVALSGRRGSMASATQDPVRLVLRARAEAPRLETRGVRAPQQPSALPFHRLARRKVDLDPRAARIEEEQLPYARPRGRAPASRLKSYLIPRALSLAT